MLAERDHSPRLAVHGFGKGRAVYLSGFRFTPENTRLLHRALYWATAKEAPWSAWSAANSRTEATYFPKARKRVVFDNAGTDESTTGTLGDGKAAKTVELSAYGIAILDA